MTIHSVYLTIDDSPSQVMDRKVDFLVAHAIPALFYCRGEFIEKLPEQVIYAIQKGFLIGNHSYSHPYFSTIPLEHCYQEILKTEDLIDQCYEKAAESASEKEKVTAMKDFLRKTGFQPVNFGRACGDFIDSFWDWDTEDYKSKLIQSPFKC